MKINKIIIGGLALLSLTACNDFLEVDPATNQSNTEKIYQSEGEISTALNGLYASILSDNLYGRYLYNDFMLNSDVDFTANSNETATGTNPRRFDNRTENSTIERFWNSLYNAVEATNEFIYNLRTSSIYEEGVETTALTDDEGVVIGTQQTPAVTNVTQMMGEAKVIRAMLYHELLSYWGDVPFTLQSTYETDNLLPAVTDRTTISQALIDDLKQAAEYMYSDQNLGDAPERISKEAAYAMIARLALQAGGYSLNHDAGDVSSYKMTRPSNYRDFYQTARDYAKKVIDAGGHKLNKSYQQVFVDECNFIANTGDDVIFEIPFAKESSGEWGYYQGPQSAVDAAVETNYTTAAWGNCNGGVRTSALYRYTFDESDLRRDYICGLWYYTNTGLPTPRFDYAMHNNKWSKLWNETGLGKSTTGSTGINFAYIRYADVLLMFAEADNEISNGPTEAAKEAMKTVRRRAFEAEDYAEKVDAYVDEATSKEDFLKIVLDERKWEFAGENMRWKDLVRNNLYSEKLMYTFLTYLSIAEDQGGSAPYMDICEEYEGIQYSQLAPAEVNTCLIHNTGASYFPNKSLYIIYIVNPYGNKAKPQLSPERYFEENELPYEAVSETTVTGSGSSSPAWTTTATSWWNEGQGMPNNQILYSLLGYIRQDNRGNLFVVGNNAQPVGLSVNTSNPESTVSSLPAVRYLLPYPEEVISRSSGAYRNYYGY